MATTGTMLRQFTVAEYLHMIAAGVFAKDDRLELIDGEVREMSPIGPLHVATVNRLTKLIDRRLPETVILSVQNPFQLSAHSMPQPDVALIRAQADFYAKELATSADILLVIEIADSSLAYYRGEKLPRYAAAGIPETWLVDLAQDQIEQHTDPAVGQYRTKRTWLRGATIQCQAVPELRLTVDEIFG